MLITLQVAIAFWRADVYCFFSFKAQLKSWALQWVEGLPHAVGAHMHYVGERDCQHLSKSSSGYTTSRVSCVIFHLLDSKQKKNFYDIIKQQPLWVKNELVTGSKGETILISIPMVDLKWSRLRNISKSSKESYIYFRYNFANLTCFLERRFFLLDQRCLICSVFF